MKQKYGIALALAVVTSDALALAGLSRVCRFDWIPGPLQGPAARLFNIIGDAPAGAFDNLSGAPLAEKKKFWIIESLTIDWGSVRYYLYVENRVYYMSPTQPWQEFRQMKSGPTWGQTMLPKEVTEDSSLRIFFANRALLYSARAGHANVIEKLNDPDSFQYRVIGNHYYFDPATKASARLGRTDIINSCNLSEWGLESR